MDDHHLGTRNYTSSTRTRHAADTRTVIIEAAQTLFAVRLTKEYLAVVADRLIELGGLRSGLTPTQVEQTLWFCFGFDAWRSVRDLGWSRQYATGWLAVQADRTLVA